MKIKYFLAVATACVLLSSAAEAMAAEAVPEPEDRECTLTVSYVSEDMVKGTREPISGATFEVTKVACLNWRGGSPEYVLTDAFGGTSINFNGMTASESKEAAEMFARMSVLSEQAVMTDGEGRAVFVHLDHGIYLVKETMKTGTAVNFSVAEPYLVLVPGYENGAWLYDVVSSPKTAPVEIILPEPDEPEVPVEPTPDIPVPDGPAGPTQTGEILNVCLWMGLAVMAATGIMILTAVRKNRRKEDNYV